MFLEFIRSDCVATYALQNFACTVAEHIVSFLIFFLNPLNPKQFLHFFFFAPTQRHRQPGRLTLTPTSNLESSVTLTFMSVDCGSKPDHLEKTQAGSVALYTIDILLLTFLICSRTFSPVCSV